MSNFYTDEIVVNGKEFHIHHMDNFYGHYVYGHAVETRKERKVGPPEDWKKNGVYGTYEEAKEKLEVLIKIEEKSETYL